jgi:hypothetical protein
MSANINSRNYQLLNELLRASAVDGVETSSSSSSSSSSSGSYLRKSYDNDNSVERPTIAGQLTDNSRRVHYLAPKHRRIRRQVVVAAAESS